MSYRSCSRLRYAVLGTDLRARLIGSCVRHDGGMIRGDSYYPQKMVSMALTDTKIRKAESRKKVYRFFDQHGLYLQIQPSGGKLWRYKYRFAGKERLMSFGPYPVVTLAMARERHLDARRLLASGVDPMAQRKEEKAAQRAGAVLQPEPQDETDLQAETQGLQGVIDAALRIAESRAQKRRHMREAILADDVETTLAMACELAGFSQQDVAARVARLLKPKAKK